MRTLHAIIAILSTTFLLGVLVLPLAYANDSAVEGASGTLRRLGGEHKSVRMLRETVRMDLHPKYYETVVDFTFVNDGPALTVKMGFPESGSGDVNPDAVNRRRTGGFLSFTTSLDGRPTKAVRTLSTSGDNDGYQAYWVKQVPFAAGQTRRIQVRYRASYGNVAMPMLNRWASYNFTGGNWRGTVAESSLIVTLREPGSFMVVPEFSLGENKSLPLGWMTRRGATFSHTWRNWQAEGQFMLRVGKAPPGWLAEPSENVTYLFNKQGNRQVVTLTVPGKVPTSLLGYDYTPNAMQADGITWLNVGGAEWVLSSLLKTVDKPSPYIFRRDDAPAQRRTLHLGNQNFVFTVGQATMTVNGKTIAIPAPPRRLRNRWRNELDMYVPLMPLVKALGGTAIVDADKHTLIVRPK